ncbi:mucosa-associated lymphoid tissue lymphoma translocation protein 1 [Limosa lapponica baueri]|uniref:Mucosa-associated lymphoid tissue lymphoma translocation protein 1 n=1 Tax=Limosa lapponica baueri TaxID=1758121 RepID=A0A2I0U0U6_LIMLA|nr:mucosa-associated lymphoid tissue lymphoma translocation protein 1 [Limosa lapponica baueri]
MSEPVRSGTPGGSLPLSRLAEPLLRRLSELLDRAAPGKGWRDLAQRAGSRGRVRLSPLDLEQCSLKVLEPEGSPSWSLLKLLGDRGCTVVELVEFLQALEHTEALQCLSHSGSLIGLPENKLRICVQPQPQNLAVGDALVLECGAVGNPIPHYQWFRNGFPLANGSKNVYTVTYVDVEHQGTYWCHVYNDQEDQDSQKIEVVIEDLSDLQKPEETERKGVEPMEYVTVLWFCFPVVPAATDKVALLIGNMSYWNHPRLKAPMVDVYELTNLLRQLDFKVVSLLDLTESEMRNAVDEFLLLLDRGVYAQARDGKTDFTVNSLCVQREKNEYDDTILILDALKVTANIVFGYATCQGAEAFEIQQLGLANGIFMKFLKDRLLEDKKITVLLDEVAEDMGKCHLTKGKQALEIRSSLSEKRALTDPIQQTVSSAESLARNLQWAKAHDSYNAIAVSYVLDIHHIDLTDLMMELPESMYVEFKCGVQIQLGFAAEFSNVMIIYTRIVKKPPEIVVCRAYVTDFPLDLDVDPKEANKGTPEETGSYLVSKDLPKHCLYTRLSSLQKLREHLIFTVCLHYEYPGIEDTMDERKEVNVGKPLIAKLGLHHGFKASNCLQTCCVANNPFHNQIESSPAAAQYYVPAHCQPSSCPGVYQPTRVCPGSARRPEPCSCNGTSQILASRHEVRDYSPTVENSNVPVETTDDTVELEFLLSDSLSFSKQQ